MKLFENRNLLIVTKHGKEQVLAPLLEEQLKVKCVLNTACDTDSFGTFSGEVDRTDDPLTTIRKKCLSTMLYHNCDLAVASEGSFGPHPNAFFAAVDDELVLLVDVKNNIEVIGRKVSLETNFAVKELSEIDDFKVFLQQVKFPSHKVILRNTLEDNAEIHKGIDTEEQAMQIFTKLRDKYGKVQVETDMRAMNNPTRMNVIKQAAENMLVKLQSKCPKCDFPGFSVKNSVAGLPCSCCNFPTRSILYEVYQCVKCNFVDQKYFPRNQYFEDPMYCDTCNP